MLKKLNMIALIFLLMMQTMITPIAATAQGKGVSNERDNILTYKPKEEIESQPDSVKTLDFQWSLSGDVEIDQAYTSEIPDGFLIAEEQMGELTYEDEQIGSFSATEDHLVSIEFDEIIEEMSEDATGMFEVEVVVESDETKQESDPAEETDDESIEESAPVDEEEVEEIEEPEVSEELDVVDVDLQKVTESVEALEKDPIEENYETAVMLIEALENSAEKAELQERVAAIQLPVVKTAEDEEKKGLTFEMGKVTNLNGVEYGEGTLLGPEDEFKLHMEWELEDGHNYKRDDTVTFDLPDGIHIGEEMSGVLKDKPGNEVAGYVITTDKKVELTFKEYVNENSGISGWLEIVAKLDLDEVEVEDGEIILREPIGEGELIIPIDESNRKKSIDKSGKPNKQFNGDEIDWEIVVNKEKLDLEGVQITDELPEGTEYKKGTLEVIKVKTSYNGAVLEELETITGVGGFTDGKLDLSLNDTKDAYLIKYTTTVTDDEKSEFKNNVTFKDKHMKDIPKDATVTIGRNDPIKKSAVTAYNPKTGIIKWEIEFNYNEKRLDDVDLLDKWEPAGKVEFVEDSLVFEEMKIDEDGKAIGTGEKGLPKGATQNIDEADQFTVSGITTNKAYKVTYQTKVKERVLGEDFTIENTAGFGDHSVEGTGGTIGQYYGSKSAGTVNYADKTMDWTIQLNQDEYPMHDIIVTDKLGPGLTLKTESVVVTVGGSSYDDYRLTPPEGSSNEFEIRFPEDYSTKKEIIIKYETDYDPNLIEDGKPENTMNVSWKPSDDGTVIEKKVGPVYGELNKATKDVNWKEGSYNPEGKEITWSIYTNYLENEVEGLKIVDTPQGNQTIDSNTEVEVYELTIQSDGTYKETKLKEGFTPDIKDNVLTVEIGGESTSAAYKVVYKTKVPGEVQGEYTNKADIYHNDELNATVKAKVGITNYKTYASKGAQQDGNQINWTVDVNLGQQEVKDLKLEDSILSATQEYVKHSIDVYEATVDVNGKATKKGEKLKENIAYELIWPDEADGKQSFEVTWKGSYAKTEKAFVVEYTTLFFAGHGTKVGNNYEVTAASGIVVDAEKSGEKKHTIKQLSGGGATGKAGKLIVHKINTTYNDGKKKNPALADEDAPGLEGAEFIVKNAATNKTVKMGTTDSNGKIDFGRLLFGDYIIEETKAPEGYVIETKSETITIKDELTGDDSAAFVHTVGNYKPVYKIDLTKTSSGNVSLEGVEFKVYTEAKDGTEVGSGTTDEDGRVVITVDPGVSGTYYVEEVASSAPENHIPLTEREKVVIGDKEKSPIPLKVLNELYPGKGKLKKVDADKTDKVLSGATFKVYKNRNEEVGTLTEEGNNTGIYVTPELAPDTYTVKETDAPTGYKESDITYDLIIPEANSVKEYVIGESLTESAEYSADTPAIKNEVKTTSINLIKQETDKNNHSLESATFKIEKVDGDYDFTETTESTDKNGYLSFEGLKPGTYKITETRAPAGYIKLSESIEVEVTHENVSQNPVQTLFNEVKNDPLAKIILEKVDSESNVVLAGAEFKLSKEGTTITDHYGMINGKFVTDAQGKFEITGLAPGNYTLTEVTAPTGYKIDKTDDNHIREFTVDANATTTEKFKFTRAKNAVVKNNIIKGSVELEKVDGDDSDIKLDGVKFELTKVNNGSGNWGTRSFTPITKETENGGKVKFDNLRPGRYKVTEVENPDSTYQGHWRIYEFDINLQNTKHEHNIGEVKNYKLVDIPVEKVWKDTGYEQPRSIDVALKQNGTQILTETLNDTDEWKHIFAQQDAVDQDGNKYTYTVDEVNVPIGYDKSVDGSKVTNTAKTTDVLLIKTDNVTKDVLKGAKFNIRLKGTTDILATETTDINGKLTFSNLQPGIYEIIEEKAPDGYYKNDDPIEVTVSHDDVANERILTKNAKNNPYADITLTKVDKDTGVALTGATFNVYGEDNKVVLEDLPVDNDGLLRITGLIEGNYTLKESKAPTGYELSKEVKKFTVDQDHDNDTIELGDFENEIELGSVKFTKKDNKKNPMKDISFTLKSTSLVNSTDTYTKTVETDEKGVFFVDNLRPGKYTITETVPDGYQYIGGELQFEIDLGASNKEIKLNDVINYEKVSIDVKKVWNDDNNDTEKRPENVEVQLYQNKDPLGAAVELDEINEWEHIFTDLDAVDNNGEKHNYTVDEVNVPEGYAKEVSGDSGTGFTITNTRSEDITISGEKMWEFGIGGEQYIPDEIAINLLKGQDDNRTKVGSQTVAANKDDDWKYEFTGIPRFDDNGVEIEYSIEEVDIPGFISKVKDFDVTNAQETIDISGEKTWKDEDTSARPEDITIQVLIKDTTTVVTEQTIDTDKDKEYTFEDLPKYDKSGEEITYVINELNVPGYVADIDGYNITNTRMDQTDISVTKKWLDEDENDRPESITVELYQNSEKFKGETTITTEDDWTYTFQNLDQFDSEGQPFTYTIKEVNVDEKYKAQEPQWDAEVNGFTITNIRTGTTKVEGTKTWLDENNPDRPESIELKVYRSVDGDEQPEEVETKTVSTNDSSKWTYSFDYPAFNDKGKKYTYSVEEIVPAGYELKEQDVFDLINVRIGTTEVTVTKEWEHKDATDLPTTIEVDLLRSIKNGESKQVNDGNEPYQLTKNDWSLTIKDLPKFDENGRLYTYEVKERRVSEYNSEVDETGLDITNTRKTYAIGDYVWVDHNKDGIQDSNEEPLSGVTVQLYDKDGKKVISTTTTNKEGRYIFDELVSGDYKVKFTLTEEQAKKYKFTTQNAEDDTKVDSDANEDGWTADISLNEDNKQLMKNYEDQTFNASEGIDPSWDAGVIELVDVVGTKTWQDDNDEAAINARPDHIIVELFANDSDDPQTTEEVSEPDWTYAFEGLDKYDENGMEITYTIDEEKVDGYEKSIDGFDMTNTRTGTTEVKVTKSWKDASDSERPESVTVKLYQNDADKALKSTELKASGDWEHTFEDLPAFDEEGKTIKYSVKEIDLDNKYKLDEVTGDAENGFTITNVRTGKIEVDIAKEWKDDDVADRPDSIEVNLLQNDTVIGEHEITAETNWQLTIADLAEFDTEGKPYTYTITEHDVSGYASEVDEFQITNTRTDQKDIEITKAWLDDESTDRPTEIEVDLFRSIKDGELENVKTYTVKAEDDWKLTIEELPSYDANGQAYTYEIKEHEVDGYESTINGFDITNLRVGTTELKGEKTWKEVASKYRPDEITVNVVANKTCVDTLQIEPDANGEWGYTFSDLQKYDHEGKEIEYSVEELEVIGYESVINGTDIVNTQIKTEVKGEKVWNNDDERYRPDAVTIQLLANGEKEVTAEVMADTDWAYEFTDLAKYDKSGEEIVYTVEEINVPQGYESKVEDYTITNTQVTTTLSGEKVWDEVDKRYRPESVTVQLLANGEKEKTVDVMATTDWTYEFTDLAKYDKSGEEIVYTVKEIDVPKGYDSKIDGFTITNTQQKTIISGEKIWNEVDESYRPDVIVVQLFANGKKESTIEITAESSWTYEFSDLAAFDQTGQRIIYTVEELEVPGYESIIEGTTITNNQITTEVTGTKTWLDDNSKDRPESITIQVKKGDKVVEAQEVTAKDNWEYTFTDLAKYDKEDQKVNYTIDEVQVDGYKQIINNHDITNVRIGTTEVEINKQWNDEGKKDRPDSILVNLHQDDNLFDVYKLTAKDDWHVMIKDLPKYDEKGKAYTYTVAEHDVAGYASKIDGFNITNTRTDKKDIQITKAWLDDHSKDRPKEIEVELHRSIKDGDKELVETHKVKASDDWKLTIKDLPVFNGDGKAYTYTIKEGKVEGYDTKVDGFNITNLRVGKTEVSGAKTWKKDKASDRPSSIIINVLQNGKEIASKQVTKADNWKFDFGKYPAYDANGKAYQYTFTEDNVVGYDTTINGSRITNTLNLVEAKLKMKADPETIVADGKSTSTLTTTVTDENGKPVPGIEVEFEAKRGTFPEGNTAITDENGKAKVIFKSDKIEDTKSRKVPVKATVRDKEKGLKGEDQITMTFEPSSITGVVTDNNTGKPIEGARLVVTDPDSDFKAEYVTGPDGKYKIPIPKGEITYDVEITKGIMINGKKEEITFKQEAKPGKISPDKKDEEFPAEKTFVGIVLMKDKNGSEKIIKRSPTDKYIIKGISKNGIGKQGEINESGVFTIEELEKDQEYEFTILQEIDGKELIMGNITVTIDDDGEISVHEELIDPYGTITDKHTGKIIGGAEVELRYADTERNRKNGRTPGSLVELPILPGFAPNDNKNTQISTDHTVWNDDVNDHGNYAWMVFPEADYYIVSKKSGYKDYQSPIISVEYDVVKFDFEMERLKDEPIPETPEPEEPKPEVPAEEDPIPEPEEPKAPEPEIKEPESPKVVEEDNNQLPKTATNIFNTMLLGISLLTLGLVTLRLRKKKEA